MEPALADLGKVVELLPLEPKYRQEYDKLKNELT